MTTSMNSEKLQRLLETLRRALEENLEVCIGDEMILRPGLKIMHVATGLAYTIDAVVGDKNDPTLVVKSGDGASLNIPRQKFKEYKVA